MKSKTTVKGITRVLSVGSYRIKHASIDYATTETWNAALSVKYLLVKHFAGDKAAYHKKLLTGASYRLLSARAKASKITVHQLIIESLRGKVNSFGREMKVVYKAFLIREGKFITHSL